MYVRIAIFFSLDVEEISIYITPYVSVNRSVPAYPRASTLLCPHAGGGCKTISSNPVTLLRAMDIEHPVGSLVLEALEVQVLHCFNLVREFIKYPHGTNDQKSINNTL